MFTRVTGAAMRAFLVGLMIATPSLLLESTGDESIEIAVLLSIIFAVVTFLEYNTTFPSLVEFRDAPPINRIRFIALFCMVFATSAIARHGVEPSNLTGLVAGIGRLTGNLLDFPFSPVHMVLLASPQTMNPDTIFVLRAAAGLTAVIALAAIGVFYLSVRLFAWPVSSGAFNVWTNLPLFDPTSGGDVVQRLQRDARLNIVIGALTPFLLPALVRAVMGLGFGIAPAGIHALIWAVSIWGFLPVSLIIRGMALLRIADLIEAKRRRTYASAEHAQTA